MLSGWQQSQFSTDRNDLEKMSICVLMLPQRSLSLSSLFSKKNSIRSGVTVFRSHLEASY